MRRFAFIAPLAASLALGSIAIAQPTGAQPTGAPTVNVTLGEDLQEESEKLGQREVALQVAELTETVQQTLASRGALQGATINLVLTDLKPNRPTFQQAIDRPGLSLIDSLSIGGATIEGEVITAQGQTLPVKFDRYSTSIADVFGYSTWHDAERAYDRLARNLAAGRYVTR
ncbi:hypothetical protein [Brevundimonas variabilis]|uniref:Uncharacterized protein n=1 Tax=Brevundimonas variabilis TaxID=74312 RepID=A0A7W9FEU8_9CAUL|nr:hypothetical protein [Brevundimonas variabilis]MBB5746816.1 hypothetical protein [Brevundimonas variabilis]